MQPAKSTTAALLLVAGLSDAPAWKARLLAAGIPTVTPDEATAKDQLVLAACWGRNLGFLQECPNLKGVMSLGAGVDQLMKPGVVPSQLPVLRIVDTLMAQRMATWVVWGVVNHQRRMNQYGAAQAARRWDPEIEDRQPVDNKALRVGILGLGVMGQSTADVLLPLGYPVLGWSRRPKAYKGVTNYHGSDQLQTFVSSCDVLVNLLPLTPDTEGLLDARLFSWLPRGAGVINGGRGRHVVDDDLLAALDEGQVGSALLDVFCEEPLSPSSRYWLHPHVRLTPHVAAVTDVMNAVQQIKENFERAVEGREFNPVNLVDRNSGY